MFYSTNVKGSSLITDGQKVGKLGTDSIYKFYFIIRSWAIKTLKPKLQCVHWKAPAAFYSFRRPGLWTGFALCQQSSSDPWRARLQISTASGPSAFSKKSYISGIKLNFFWRWLTQTHDRFFPRYPTPYVYFILALFWMYWTQVTYSFYMLKGWWRAINSLKITLKKIPLKDEKIF